MSAGIAYELRDSPSFSATTEECDFTRKFLVACTNYNDGPIVAASAIGVPALWQVYATPGESHPYARVHKVSAERREPNSLQWVITCEYQTPTGKKDNPDQQSNPLLEIPTITFSFENYQEVALGAWDQNNPKGITNSAGELYDPPPMQDKSRLVLEITRPEDISTPHPALAQLYQDKLNSDTFWGQPAGTAKFCGINVERRVKDLPGGIQFVYLMSKYVIHFRSSWALNLLDAGSFYKDSQNPSKPKKKCITADGHPYIGLLDGNSGKLADGADPVFLPPIDIYKQLPFSVLNLPGSFV